MFGPTQKKRTASRSVDSVGSNVAVLQRICRRGRVTPHVHELAAVFAQLTVVHETEIACDSRPRRAPCLPPARDPGPRFEREDP